MARQMFRGGKTTRRLSESHFGNDSGEKIMKYEAFGNIRGS